MSCQHIPLSPLLFPAALAPGAIISPWTTCWISLLPCFLSSNLFFTQQPEIQFLVFIKVTQRRSLKKTNPPRKLIMRNSGLLSLLSHNSHFPEVTTFNSLAVSTILRLLALSFSFCLFSAEFQTRTKASPSHPLPHSHHTNTSLITSFQFCSSTNWIKSAARAQLQFT